MIYLDNNATTRPLPEVVEAMKEALTDFWFNPSAAYKSAHRVAEKIEEARFHVAELVGASPQEIVFTSGGTEATNTVLHYWAHLEKGENKKIISTLIEHPATLKTIQVLAEKKCWSPSLIGVSPDGMFSEKEWVASLAQENVVGASFSLAQNETGVLADGHRLVSLAHEYGVPVHVDVIQAVGKSDLSLDKLGAEFASISAHKFHGPKGVGALYIRRGMGMEPFILGGGQEGNRRSGTENVPGIIGMGVAARLAKWQLQERLEKMNRLRDLFESSLREKLQDVIVHGEASSRLPNTSDILFKNCPAEGLNLLLQDKGICASMASACKSGQHDPSHVLTAMGVSEKDSKSSLRFSLSYQTNELEVQEAVSIIVEAVHKLRKVQSGSTGPVLIYRPS